MDEILRKINELLDSDSKTKEKIFKSIDEAIDSIIKTSSEVYKKYYYNGREIEFDKFMEILTCVTMLYFKLIKMGLEKDLEESIKEAEKYTL